MKYKFSHNDTQEQAQQVKDRTANAVIITKGTFVDILGQSETAELFDSIGTPQKCYQKDDMVWVSIGNIDYVFKSIDTSNKEVAIESEGSVLTPDIAIEFVPQIKIFDDSCVFIPNVDCGDGYKQLKWLEEINNGDEWYTGSTNGWQLTTLVGSRYRPTHSNAEYAPFALTRRLEN